MYVYSFSHTLYLQRIKKIWKKNFLKKKWTLQCVWSVFSSFRFVSRWHNKHLRSKYPQKSAFWIWSVIFIKTFSQIIRIPVGPILCLCLGLKSSQSKTVVVNVSNRTIAKCLHFIVIQAVRRSNARFMVWILTSQ